MDKFEGLHIVFGENVEWGHCNTPKCGKGQIKLFLGKYSVNGKWYKATECSGCLEVKLLSEELKPDEEAT